MTEAIVILQHSTTWFNNVIESYLVAKPERMASASQPPLNLLPS